MTTANPSIEPNSNELIFGLVAPIGVDLVLVAEVLSETLKEQGFNSETSACRITSLMKQVDIGLPFDAGTYIDQVKCRIAYANKMRLELGNDALAVMAVSAIRKFRKDENIKLLIAQDSSFKPEDGVFYEEHFLPNQAYIIRQLKRPEEVETLRRIYGDRFILIGANAPLEVRKRHINDEQTKSLGGLILRWLRLSEQLRAGDKWIPAGFLGRFDALLGCDAGRA